MPMLLGTSYLPGRIYLEKIRSATTVSICGGSPWQRQTLRNRTYILSPNGIQRLVIPVIHSGVAVPDSAMEIDYTLPWIREHKGALEAAYNTSPFFEFIREELFEIYQSRPSLLFDLNIRILSLLLRKMKCSAVVHSAPEVAAELSSLDCINRKILPDDSHLPAYPQVFSYKYGFTCQLSGLDQLVNTGY